jgi:hypothetical protein
MTVWAVFMFNSIVLFIIEAYAIWFTAFDKRETFLEA